MLHVHIFFNRRENFLGTKILLGRILCRLTSIQHICNSLSYYIFNLPNCLQLLHDMLPDHDSDGDISRIFVELVQGAKMTIVQLPKNQSLSKGSKRR